MRRSITGSRRIISATATDCRHGSIRRSLLSGAGCTSSFTRYQAISGDYYHSLLRYDPDHWRNFTSHSDLGAGRRVLFHSLCVGVHLRHMPNNPVSSHQQHTEPPSCPVLHDGYGIQSRNVPRFDGIPTFELCDVCHHAGDGELHELGWWYQNLARHFLVFRCCVRRLAFCFGALGTIFIRGIFVRKHGQQGCCNRQCHAHHEGCCVWASCPGK